MLSDGVSMSFREAEAKKEIDTIPKPVGLGP